MNGLAIRTLVYDQKALVCIGLAGSAGVGTLGHKKTYGYGPGCPGTPELGPSVVP